MERSEKGADIRAGKFFFEVARDRELARESSLARGERFGGAEALWQV